jgi:Na+-driven multidrug efflux pump
MDPRTQILLEGPIARTLLRLAVPNILVLGAQAAAGLVETYFIGKLGTESLAGVALVFPVVMLMQMMSAGAMGGGISSAIARALGGSRRADANALPAIVTLTGTVFLIPLSPVLIFGLGPFPAFGIAGGAIALLAYYAVGTGVLWAYLWFGKSVLHPSLRGVKFRWPLFRDILRVGAVAALVTLSTNLTIVIGTGLVGEFGTAAIAGYGTGARLEYLLVPVVFGLGAPMVVMVGTNIGAGKRERAFRVAWIGAGIATALTEAIGLCAAAFPHVWLSLFDTDPAMLESGASYLRVVGPFYGMLGLALSLYFASQGAGRLAWPLMGNMVRLAIAAAGGFVALRLSGEIAQVFWAQSAALVAFGLINAVSVAGGAWFRGTELADEEVSGRDGSQPPGLMPSCSVQR